MYQSKLAKPEVKPHFYWNRTLKYWVYESTNPYSVVDGVNLVTKCVQMDEDCNPLKANK